MKTSSNFRRSIVIIPAAILLAFGISLNILGDLGSDVLTSFEQGVAINLGTSIGTIATIFNMTVLVIFLFVNKSFIHYGSIILAISIGPLISLFLSVFQSFYPNEPVLWLRVLCVLLGTTIIATALSWYLPIELGVQPMDMVVLTISKSINRSYGVGLIIFSSFMFLGTVLLKGPWGLGTAINLLCVGKLVDVIMPRITPFVKRLAGIVD